MKQIISDIIKQLESISYEGDISDIGNEIGIAIGKHVGENKIGYELDSFIHGVRHGVSLVDGTH